ncbi:MAG: fimbrillin family protein [Bacteroidaceae bacterium]|nr:fimbrillin family protein [Bacteroidaceae bacterium]
MKKYLFILATAAIVVSCSDQDTFKKDIQNGKDEAISFVSYSQPTTKAENSSQTAIWDFFTHHATFQVWGYKNTNKTAVFSADVVTVAAAESPATGYTYTYSPTRYWDKAATTYRFYAAAPSNADWSFEGVSNDDNQDQSAGYFKTTSTINGDNLMATPNTTLSNSFKSATNDKDKLIAEPCVVNKAKFSQDVQLNFIHILSKLNVSIQKHATKLASQTVTLKSFEVKNLYNKGDFDENTSVTNLAAGSNDRWTKAAGATAVTYSSKTNWVVPATKTYIIESLVIPQDAAVEVVALDGEHHDAVLYSGYEEYNQLNNASLANEAAFNELTTEQKTKEAAIAKVTDSSEPYFKIVYTIQDGNNTAEEFTAFFNLATAFKGTAAQASTLKFNEGWQNTLNITIEPDEIDFCADVYQWATTEKDLTVK